MANSWRNHNCSNNSLCLLNIGVLAICVGIYLLNRSIPTECEGFRTQYLNDLLAMPLLLSYSQLLCIYKGKRLKVKHMIILLFFCSFMWEGVTPAIWSKSIRDYLDVLQYTIGTIVYIGICMVGGMNVFNKVSKP